MKNRIDKNFHTSIRIKYLDYIKQHPYIPELIKCELTQVVIGHLQTISQTFAMLELMEKRTRQKYTEKGLFEKIYEERDVVQKIVEKDSKKKAKK